MQASDGINLSRMDEQTYDAPLIKKSHMSEATGARNAFFWTVVSGLGGFNSNPSACAQNAGLRSF